MRIRACANAWLYLAEGAWSGDDLPRRCARDSLGASLSAALSRALAQFIRTRDLDEGSRGFIVLSAVPTTQPPAHLSSRAPVLSHPEDSLKARRPELDGRRHNGAHYKDVYRMKTKRGGGVGGETHRGLKPPFIFFFLSPEVNGTFSLKQSLLSWVEKPRKSTWQTESGRMESER